MRFSNVVAGLSGPLVAGYLALALVACIGFLLVVPPMKVPDEPHHFLRISQLAAGNLLGGPDRSGVGPSGGLVDPGVIRFIHALEPVSPSRPLTPAADLAARAVVWGGPATFAAFPNTAAYAPGFYLPQVLGVALGRTTGLTVQASYTLGRWLAAAATFMLGAVALWQARRGRVLIAICLGLPMTLFLAASVSQDGPLIAAGGLLAALLSRIAVEARASRAMRLGVALLLASMALARTPYALLSLVVLLSPWRALFGGWRAMLVPALALGLALAWSSQVDPLGVRWMRPDDDLDAGRQLALLLREPGAVPRIAWTTLKADAQRLVNESIGVLGWLNLVLPKWAYQSACAAIGLAILAAGADERNRQRPLAHLGVLAILLGVTGAMFAANYLSWTPVGADRVEGMQGRYVLPLLPLLALVMPPLTDGWRWLAAAAGPAALVLGLIVMAGGASAVLRAFG